MTEITEYREDIEEFQGLLSEAVQSITRRGVDLVAKEPKRFMQMHELPFPVYIPGLVKDLQTPLYTNALRLANNIFSEKAQETNTKQYRALRGIFRQCINDTASINHFPTPLDDHAWRVGRIAVAIGREIGLTKSDLCELFWGGFLHDVGKLFITELELILIAQGLEYSMILPLVRTHASLGGLFLESVYPLFPFGAICAYQHQESVDGTGYQGLRYEQVTTEGRIVNLADNYDATVTRVAWSAARVCEENRQQYARAGHPDDAVLLAFLRVVERYHAHWYPGMG